MGVLSYCKIDDMVISRNMQNHLNEIESKVALGNLLATSVHHHNLYKFSLGV